MTSDERQEPLPAAHPETELLERVSGWYRNRPEDFYTQLVSFTYRSIRPRFVGGRCLELGPADGVMTRELVEHFDQLTVVDGSASYIEELRSLFPGVRAEASLFETFEPGETYDTIVMSHVLEHVEDPVLVARRVRSWLAPGGVAIAVVPNALSLHRRLGVKMGLLDHEAQLNAQDLEIGHRRVYRMDELVADLAQAGLDVQATGGVYLKLLSNAQMADLGGDVISGLYELGKDLPELCSEIFAVCAADVG